MFIALARQRLKASPWGVVLRAANQNRSIASGNRSIIYQLARRSRD